MTDTQFDVDPDAPVAPPRGRRFRGAVNGLGAIVSIALVVGMSFWAYKLAVRDVSGVPVVRALEGPMRVTPEDPGGMQAAYQGLAVNTVAAQGSAAPAPDRIVLAPPPVSLDLSEDIVPEGATRGLHDPNELAPLTEVALESEAADAALNAMPAVAAADRPVPDMALAQIVGADVPGVARSPVPRARPSGDLVAEAAASAALAALAPEGGSDVDPASLTPGTRLVQLGAFDDEAAARAEWEKLARRFSALMEGKGRVVQDAESGGRTFYRLRATGFDDEAEARRFCAVLLAEQAGCIPVLIR